LCPEWHWELTTRKIRNFRIAIRELINALWLESKGSTFPQASDTSAMLRRHATP